MNVFVFPACNEPGLETIQSLAKSNKIALFGGSSDKGDYDPARPLLAHYVPCPRYDDPAFEQAFKQILRVNGIDVVFPAWDPLVALFSEWRMDGTVFVTPRPEIAKLLLSKRATYERLQDFVPVPRILAPESAGLPLFAKPDCSSGSRDTMIVNTSRQLEAAIEQDLLLSEYLPGDEYTVDCISDLEGRLLFANPRVRGNIGRGIAIGTRDVRNARIMRHVDGIAAALRIEGPWFAQFKENAKGEPVLIEINARIAGSMTLTRLCGVNIPLIAAFLYAGHPVRIPRPRTDVILNRRLGNYAECDPFDWVVWDWDDTILRKDGKPDPDVVACLYDLRNRGVRQALLSKNPDVLALLHSHQIPNFFASMRCGEDKAALLAALLDELHIDPRRCIMVNDSYAEIFAVQERFPDLRTVTPDALEILGRERVT